MSNFFNFFLFFYLNFFFQKSAKIAVSHQISTFCTIKITFWQMFWHVSALKKIPSAPEKSQALEWKKPEKQNDVKTCLIIAAQITHISKNKIHTQIQWKKLYTAFKGQSLCKIKHLFHSCKSCLPNLVNTFWLY